MEDGTSNLTGWEATFPVLRARVDRSRDDLELSSSGEKVVKRVSGVPSCLYESAPPSLGGEDGLNDIS